MIGRTATTKAEQPVFFAAAGQTLFGVFTRPIVDPLGVAVVVLPGGGTPFTVNRNRLSVRLCRRLSAAGFHVMRFDYHGGGESSGVLQSIRLDRPFVEDLRGAVQWIAHQGVARLVLMGSCFGARTALATAVKEPTVEAAILVSLPLHDVARGERSSTPADRIRGRYLRHAFHSDVLRGLFERRRRRKYVRYFRAKWGAVWQRMRAVFTGTAHDAIEPVSPSVLRALESLVERRARLLLLYGEEDGFYREFLHQKQGSLAGMLRRGGSRLEVRTLPGRVHGFTRVSVQDEVLAAATAWLKTHFG
jgi:pimeloyl-ACP methyl ester carboxylesterase